MAQLFLDRLPGRQVFVALLVLPVVVSPIVAGATWSLMFDNRFGPINQIIGWIAGHETTLLWTINPHLVYPAILAAEVWQWTPFMFLLLLAALSNVDKSQLEAAAIDGAGYWRTFCRIVLPAIWPVMAVAILIRGARPVPAVRHRLGADQRRPRHHDRDDLDLHLRQGLPAVRDQLHRGGRAADHRAAVGRGVRWR